MFQRIYGVLLWIISNEKQRFKVERTKNAKVWVPQRNAAVVSLLDFRSFTYVYMFWTMTRQHAVRKEQVQRGKSDATQLDNNCFVTFPSWIRLLLRERCSRPCLSHLEPARKHWPYRNRLPQDIFQRYLRISISITKLSTMIGKPEKSSIYVARSSKIIQTNRSFSRMKEFPQYQRFRAQRTK